MPKRNLVRWISPRGVLFVDAEECVEVCRKEKPSLISLFNTQVLFVVINMGGSWNEESDRGSVVRRIDCLFDCVAQNTADTASQKIDNCQKADTSKAEFRDSTSRRKRSK